MSAQRAAGILFIAGDRVLLLKRSPSAKDAPSAWGLPAGHIEEGEDAAAAALRETREETGYDAGDRAGKRLWTTDDGFVCFGQRLAKPFAVRLNSEHTEARWAPFDALPEPLHPGLVKELSAMPLIQGKSDKARSENIATEVRAGKSPAQAAAIGYSVQRKAQANDAINASASPTAPRPGHFEQRLSSLHKLAADCMAHDSKRRR